MALDVGVTRRRFTLDEYHRMGEAGILHEDDRVELIHGEIVQMSPIGPPHAGCVAFMAQTLSRRIGDRAVVWPQNPVMILPDSEPQPDIVLLRPGTYRTGHPQPDDILLLIEIADTSIRYDRIVKLPLYASAGIREVWIIDIGEAAVDVYRDPAAESYRRHQRLTRGAALAPEVFPDLSLEVSEILG